MDLTGKTSLANQLQANCKDKDVQIIRSSFSNNNPLNKLAANLRRERENGTFSEQTLKQLYAFAEKEDPVLLQLLKQNGGNITDEMIGHLYADATAKELELFHPTKSIIHDSSTIIKTLSIHTELGSDAKLIKKLETLRQKHPKPTKPEYSILLESSPEAKIDRLKKRTKAGSYVSDADKLILTNPDRIKKQSEIMHQITLHTFPGTLVFDTTNMTEQEVFDAVRNHLDIIKGRN